MLLFPIILIKNRDTHSHKTLPYVMTLLLRCGFFNANPYALILLVCTCAAVLKKMLVLSLIFIS